jgi:predicted anti-sigma-YlaC factor YlaD
MSLSVEDSRCIRARRMLSLALDGEAGASAVLVAASHVSRCERCHRFAVHVVELTHVLRSTGQATVARENRGAG